MLEFYKVDLLKYKEDFFFVVPFQEFKNDPGDLDTALFNPIKCRCKRSEGRLFQVHLLLSWQC